ncbi:hypothetical protein MUNTM_16180 [Mycobacterium sp. MUNTM1]
MALIHSANGAAAAVIASADGPCQPLDRFEIADSYAVVAESNWAANPSHADAAANIDPEPGPA